MSEWRSQSAANALYSVVMTTVGEQAQVCFFSDATKISKNSGWGLDG